MEQDAMIMLGVGLGFAVLGGLLSFKKGVAEWGLARGRARIWVKLLGLTRAVKLTRFVFGPVLILLGLFLMLGSLARPATPPEATASPTATSVPDEATHGH